MNPLDEIPTADMIHAIRMRGSGVFCVHLDPPEVVEPSADGRNRRKGDSRIYFEVGNNDVERFLRRANGAVQSLARRFGVVLYDPSAERTAFFPSFDDQSAIPSRSGKPFYRHRSINVIQALLRFDNAEMQAELEREGSTQTAIEVKSKLIAELLFGRYHSPIGQCPDFDGAVGACPGHFVEEWIELGGNPADPMETEASHGR